MDKRNYSRFLVEENVIVALLDGFSRIGRAKDIGLGGLSFEHIYEGSLDLIDSRKDILLWNDDFRLPKIPCRIVYDIPLQIRPEYSLITIQLITRRCGVQFDPLTSDQANSLNLFLKTYTKGIV